MITLPKVLTKNRKRLGRGYGSGKGGHTSSRGQKGQKARTKVGILFEGTKMKKSFIKRLPLRRGKGKFKSQEKPIIVQLMMLNSLPSGTKIDTASLISHGIVNEKDALRYGIKILGNGELTKKLVINIPISKSAAEKVKKAGGTIGSETK